MKDLFFSHTKTILILYTKKQSKLPEEFREEIVTLLRRQKRIYLLTKIKTDIGRDRYSENENRYPQHWASFIFVLLQLINLFRVI